MKHNSTFSDARLQNTGIKYGGITLVPFLTLRHIVILFA